MFTSLFLQSVDIVSIGSSSNTLASHRVKVYKLNQTFYQLQPAGKADSGFLSELCNKPICLNPFKF